MANLEEEGVFRGGATEEELAELWEACSTKSPMSERGFLLRDVRENDMAVKKIRLLASHANVLHRMFTYDVNCQQTQHFWARDCLTIRLDT